MSFFPDPNIGFSYCLTCAGTGIRGGKLSGKKKCRTCEGSGKRKIRLESSTRTTLDSYSENHDASKRCPVCELGAMLYKPSYPEKIDPVLGRIATAYAVDLPTCTHCGTQTVGRKEAIAMDAAWAQAIKEKLDERLEPEV